MSFDLTIKQCDAGPSNSLFAFFRDGEQVRLFIKDVSQQYDLADGYGAVLISYQQKLWLYVFQSGVFPPQEPKLLLNAGEGLSIEGAGLALLLKSASVEESVREIEERLAVIFREMLA